MAQSTEVENAPHKTPQEMKEWYEKNSEYLKFAKATKSADEALKNLRDVTKTTTFRTVQSFDRSSLRTYLA